MNAAPSRDTSAAVEVSVVIPFRNAAPHIRDQLEALSLQEFTGTWEVIAVDNGSSDESRQVADSFKDRLNLHIVDAVERAGAAWATNVGVRKASGQKLIFIDADDEVTPGYVSAMAAGLDEYGFVISAFDHEALNPDWVRSAHGDFSRDPDNPLVDHFGVLPSAGGSVGIARSIFENVGGFPEDFPRMYDIAMSWEVQFR
jgi:glycosyltransferase involved in cell wall biosynthesis